MEIDNLPVPPFLAKEGMGGFETYFLVKTIAIGLVITRPTQREKSR
jgi:hypothetical protein